MAGTCKCDNETSGSIKCVTIYVLVLLLIAYFIVYINLKYTRREENQLNATECFIALII